MVKSDNADIKNRARIIDKYLTETEEDNVGDTPHFQQSYDETKSMKK